MRGHFSAETTRADKAYEVAVKPHCGFCAPCRQTRALCGGPACLELRTKNPIHTLHTGGTGGCGPESSVLTLLLLRQ